MRVGGTWHIVGNILMRGTTLLSTSLQSKVFTRNYGLPKRWEFQFREFWDSRLGSPEKNNIWMHPLWLIINNTIRGKVMISPSPRCGESYEFIYVCDLFMHQKCSNYALANLLFGLCKSMWIIDPFVIRHSPHPRAPTHLSYPQSVAS